MISDPKTHCVELVGFTATLPTPDGGTQKIMVAVGWVFDETTIISYCNVGDVPVFSEGHALCLAGIWQHQGYEVKVVPLSDLEPVIQVDQDAY